MNFEYKDRRKKIVPIIIITLGTSVHEPVLLAHGSVCVVTILLLAETVFCMRVCRGPNLQGCLLDFLRSRGRGVITGAVQLGFVKVGSAQIYMKPCHACL